MYEVVGIARSVITFVQIIKTQEITTLRQLFDVSDLEMVCRAPFLPLHCLGVLSPRERVSISSSL
jgi:hypothetical protein